MGLVGNFGGDFFGSNPELGGRQGRLWAVLRGAQEWVKKE
jgi:hypothetical protein